MRFLYKGFQITPLPVVLSTGAVLRFQALDNSPGKHGLARDGEEALARIDEMIMGSVK